MRTVRCHEFGSPHVLQVVSAPDPEPGPGEVLIDVEAAGISFADVRLRAGGIPVPLPFSPGFEVAGVVVGVGSGVDSALVGRPVVAIVGGGGYSSMAVAPVSAVRMRPDSLSLQDALGLVGQGVTALGVMSVAGVRAGDVVLVEAAAGGVGSLLVQLVKRAGGTVVAAARGEEKLAVAKELGADRVVDYSVPGWAAGMGEVTVVLGSVGGAVGRESFGALTDGVGRMVVYGSAAGDSAVSVQEVFERGLWVGGFVSTHLSGQRREGFLDEAFSSGLRVVAGFALGLGEVAQAHRMVEERGTVGKNILLT